MSNKVKTRLEMSQLLDERMNKTYTSLAEKQELEPDTSLVKTYLEEAHLPETASSEQVFKLTRMVFDNEAVKRKFSARIRQTEEEYFFLVEASFKKEPITLYLDATNPRFWVLHSMNSSGALDSMLNGLIATTPLLDKAWIPTHLLLAMTKFGQFRGLGLDYDRRDLPDVDFDTDLNSVQFLKMQLWGNKASEVLGILSGEGAFPNETTLAKVSIKHRLNGNGHGGFSIDDIKFDGKITARGTSFQSHIDVVQKIYTDYKDLVGRVEREFQLRSVTGQDLTILGEPVNIVFQRPIADLTIFCDHLFNSSDPFRLWGVPVFRGENYVSVSAVDLHVGTRLDFEITNEIMRVYLPEGGCGNSIVRLYTNLQHTYDSLITAENGDGRSIFE
ncbi:MAG: hypothetical protein ABI623_10330 [bacterium]